MRTQFLWLGGAAVTLIAGPLHAQGQNICDAVGQLTVGDWAQYELQNMPEVGAALRFAYVANVELNGQTHGHYTWDVLASDGTRTAGAELYIPKPHGILDIQNVTQGTVQFPGQPPFPITAEFAPILEQTATSQGLDFHRQCRNATTVGQENLSLPVGTVSTTRLRAQSGAEIWVSRTHPLGAVQARFAGNRGVRLTAFGRN